MYPLFILLMALPAAYIALAILFADKAPPSDDDDDSWGAFLNMLADGL